MKIFSTSFLITFSFAIAAQFPTSSVLGGGGATTTSTITTDQPSASFTDSTATISMNPNTDAGELLRYVAAGKNEKVLAMLLAYVQINDPNVKTPAQLQSYLQTNNTLLAELVLNSFLTLKVAESTSATAATGDLSNFGGTAFVDAFGSFLADRFKEELTIRYLEKFKTELTTGDAADDFKKVLPSTHEVLVLSDVFRFSEFVKTLQDAFQDDLKELPGNFPDWMREKNDKDEHLKYYLLYDFARSVAQDGSNPLRYLSEIENNELLKDAEEIIRTSKEEAYIFNSIRLSGVFIRAFAKESGNGIVTSSKIFNDPQIARLFVGLVLEKERSTLKTIEFPRQGGAVSVIELINTKLKEGKEALELIKPIHNSILDIVAATSSVESAVKKGTKIPFSEVESTLGALEELANELKDFFPDYDENSVKNTWVLANDFAKLVKLIGEEKFGLALTHSVALMNTMGVDENSAFYKAYKKYGQFIVNVAEAESKEEMQAAIELAAMPVGSYRVKRSVKYNIALNGYVGFVYGKETLRNRGTMDVPVSRNSKILGMTAPVGLAFSTSNADDVDRNGSSWSLFVSIIDLGAVTAFRLKEDAATDLPEVELKNFIAPGAYLIHGFKNTPLSLGAGWQYGPQVRNIANFEESDVVSAHSVRVFLAVDIPLINFHSKSE